MQLVRDQLSRNQPEGNRAKPAEFDAGPAENVQTLSSPRTTIKITDLLAGKDNFTNKLKAALLTEM